MGLELHVKDDELSALDDDLRPDFYIGMSCPVAECGNRSYNSINTLWKHWKKVHRERIPIFKCIQNLSNGLCAFTSTEIGDVRKHHLKKHSKLEIKIHREMALNTKHIPARDAKCPKRPKNLDAAGRDEAAETRHKQPCLLEDKAGPITTRDEGYTLTKRTVNGVTEYKAHTYVKKHWQPSFRK
ncbi:MAG: hypothetical protein AB2693_33095 [Candidatus Thiodiazotropha sp.]